MLKKITVGFSIATLVFFILSISTIPFAIRNQADEFSDAIVLDEDAREETIDVKSPKYTFILKDRSGVRLEESYDNKIHINFAKATLGKPEIDVEEQEGNFIVHINNKIEGKYKKFFSLLEWDQRCIIYVPADVEVDIKGDYYVYDCDDNVNYPGYDNEEDEDDSYNDTMQNYQFYKDIARMSDMDSSEAKVRKLVYAGSLIAMDYAQQDLSKPMYIDYMVLLKDDIATEANTLLCGKNQEFYAADTDTVFYAMQAYLDDEFDLVYAKEQLKEEKENLSSQDYEDSSSEDANVTEDANGNITITNEDGQIVVDANVIIDGLNQDIEAKKAQVAQSKTEFENALSQYFSVQSEIASIVDIFTI